jgi:hypothetical protein
MIKLRGMRWSGHVEHVGMFLGVLMIACGVK